MRGSLHDLKKGGALILVGGVIAALLTSCQPDAATPDATVPAVEETATASSPATETPEPTDTAEPTDTPAPTDTPHPADTATPAATATAESATEEPADEEAAASLVFAPFGDGPVVPNGAPGSFDSQFTDPGAAVFHDGLFHMFHNGFTGWPAPVGIAYSTSPDGYEWTRVQEEPVFRGDDLEYAGLTVLASSALVEADGTWVLYFYTWDARIWPNSSSSIGRATAPDPLGPWTADPQPVLLPGSEGTWDELAVRTPSVIRTEDGYVMFYAGVSAGADQAMIGMATSADGVSWTKYDDAATTDALFAESDPVFRPGEEGAWDAGNVEHPRVALVDGRYVMVYSGKARLNVPSVLGYATSEDGVSWQRAPDPILEATMIPGGRAIWFSELVHHEDTYFLFFELGTGGQTEVYLATHEGELPGGEAQE